jgi:hypothetical protein
MRIYQFINRSMGILIVAGISLAIVTSGTCFADITGNDWKGAPQTFQGWLLDGLFCNLG